MTIPILSNVIAPNSLWSATVRGRLMRRNRRGQNSGGFMQINVRWSNSLRKYEFGTVPLSLDNWRSLEALYEITDAGAYGFLLQDPSDCIIDVDTGKAAWYESSDNNYQLIERKTAAGSVTTHDRTIRRLHAGSFRIFNGVTEIVSFTLDENTGIVNIPAAPNPANLSWSGRTYVPVHFENDDLDWDLVVAGDAESRLFVGPTVSLIEVREQ